MPNFDDFDDDEFDDMLDDLTFDISEMEKDVQNKVPEFNSEKLCQIIVCDRYFHLNKDLALTCMEELAKRRINGDNFDFENYIDQSLKELPPLDFSMPDLRAVLTTAISNKSDK